MRYALEWLRENQGEAGGGFLDDHPSIAERIARLDAIHAGQSNPWDEFRRTLAAAGDQQSVARYLESHPDTDARDVLLDGLLRVDDLEILERTRLVAHMLQ